MTDLILPGVSATVAVSLGQDRSTQQENKDMLIRNVDRAAQTINDKEIGSSTRMLIL
jgi:hypothetical protein